MDFNLEKLNEMIYIIRGQKVMLDSDLAALYGVETKVLNRQVRRNIIRFPSDFMFELNEVEYENLKCQFGTSSWSHGGRRKKPLVFTEQGVAMLSSVLRSETAALVNIAIMRLFIKLRNFHSLESELVQKMNQLEKNTNGMFKIVFQRMDDIEENIPLLPKKRKKIGL